MSQLILVLDFGGQYKELIARQVRGLSVYSEIKNGNLSAEAVKALDPIGIILTGGPNSVYADNAPKCDPAIFNLGIPVLGICYGMQLMCHSLGGEVVSCERGEYGTVNAEFDNASKLFKDIADDSLVLMSHCDRVKKLPIHFIGTSFTAECSIAACEYAGSDATKKLFGVQFHPETEHTAFGKEIMKNFLYDICGATGDYKLDDYINTQINQIRTQVGNQKVLLALSGGVDSSVCAALLSKAIPGQLECVFVDHGFMRLHEGDEIEAAFAPFDLNLIRVNGETRFLNKVAGISEPEAKRKIIGEEFVRVFEEESGKLGDIPFLAQGTIYPDIVESGGEHGATIKSHHNVGGLPENHKFTGLVEPLSGLFKDEVRIIGEKLGLPAALVHRQPFPGPGLAIRVIGELTKEKLDTLRHADAIVREELDKLEVKPNQYFAVMTDTYSVGVKGDFRTYDPVVAIRAVVTTDFMTCDYMPLPHDVLGKISARITSEIKNVSRVVYDITSKPPSTIEWE